MIYQLKDGNVVLEGRLDVVLVDDDPLDLGLPRRHDLVVAGNVVLAELHHERGQKSRNALKKIFFLNEFPYGRETDSFQFMKMLQIILILTLTRNVINLIKF
jgi:hypothetical protein